MKLNHVLARSSMCLAPFLFSLRYFQSNQSVNDRWVQTPRSASIRSQKGCMKSQSVWSQTVGSFCWVTYWSWWCLRPVRPWCPGRSHRRTSYLDQASGNGCARRCRPASTCGRGRRWFLPRRARWGFPQFVCRGDGEKLPNKNKICNKMSTGCIIYKLTSVLNNSHVLFNVILSSTHHNTIAKTTIRI